MESKSNETIIGKNQLIGSILLTSAVWMGIIAASIYMKEYSSISIPSLNINTQKTEVVRLARDVKNGFEIKQSDIRTDLVPVNYVIPNTLNNEKLIVGKIAQRNLYKNEQIKKEDILEKSLKNNVLRPCTLAISLNSLSDNSITSGDYVDVVLNYKKNNIKPDIVVSKAIVKSVNDSKGIFVNDSQEKSPENKQIPAYITIMCPLNDSLLIEDAKKQGTLSFYLYNDKNATPSEKTYIPSWEQQLQTKTTN